jgi:hypothetical protein
VVTHLVEALHHNEMGLIAPPPMNNSSGHTTVLGMNQPLTEMSTMNIYFLGAKAVSV